MPLLKTGLPTRLEHIHILGICGTAMGAVAGMLKDAGYRITGSDTGAYPPMSDYLASLGISILEGFKAENLDCNPDLVVVGNVIRAVYEEAQAVVDRDLPYCSMPYLLGELFLKDARSIVVCGTHGKTTTTAIALSVLAHAGRDPGYLVGGVPLGLDRSARAGAGEVFVIEGDEYDTAYFDKQPKFMHYRPTTAILTSVEFDHADIYRDLDHVKENFRRLSGLLPADGCLIARWDHAHVRDVVNDLPCELRTYGPGQAWQGEIQSVDTQTGTMTFTVTVAGQPFGQFTSSMVGEHNLWNQVAVVAALEREGLSAEEIAAGLEDFQGIKRRQEVRGEVGGVTVIDDFAHHPTAVRVTLEALRLRFGGRRIWAIFEPRSNTSRRNIFQNAYAEAFDAADEVIIPAPKNVEQIKAEERFDSGALVSALLDRGLEAHQIDEADEIAAVVVANAIPHDVIAVLSNGSFDGLHDKLLARLRERFGDQQPEVSSPGSKSISIRSA
jgi:UDP-N-acetylmuramate: L-alanyl-gamma-D-glutamyl-meso-diaminopimelate ligase